ncbi:MAG TPA: DUF1553 domain-containing protein [Bryobacteraceae bacterium]|nr:DUF1553 domain-containing protein [Bryobacteraceae bacterium]
MIHTQKSMATGLLLLTMALGHGWAEAPPKLLSLRLMPKERTLHGKTASQQFLVIGQYSDKRERDLTGQARFTLSNPGSARADEAGRVFAVADGQTALTAVAGGLSARASLKVEGSGVDRPFSFPRDIIGIFTRRGCNTAGCHGGIKGQAGFKLSTQGIHPKEDYKWIVQGGVFQVLTEEIAGQKKPRIDLKNPEQSLILQKATMGIPHGGGLRLEKGSEDFNAIVNWVRLGASYGAEDKASNPKVARLEVFPRDIFLRAGEKHRLLVTAFYEDGRAEDFTHQVLYEAGQSSVASVSSSGLVEAKKPGETGVLIKAVGNLVRAGVGVLGEPLKDYPQVSRNNFIDDEVFDKLRLFSIVPSDLSSDAEFLRRICLDLAGTAPPPERVREFVASKDPKKREKLIETLLASPEYIDYWTFRFADLFRVAVFPVGINPKWSQAYWQWIRDSIAENKPYNQIALERISAQGYSAPSRHYLPYFVVPPPQDSMGEQVRVFMGRRLDCAQCHDHPYEQWSQDQFWGMAAFFGAMFKLGGNPAAVVFDHPGGKEIAADVAGAKDYRVLHPRTKQEVVPALLDGKQIPYTANNFPRLEMAKWMTSHPYFAEAAVNRIWSNFFGRGIVDPVDDYRSTNPPTHPQLLRRLASYFADSGYDLKKLMRLIAQSRTYQLSSRTKPGNEEDTVNYSHALARALDAEILLDAISDVTGVPETFSMQMPDAKGPGGQAPPGTRAVQLKETDIYHSPFLDIYGRPNRFSVPERNAKPNLSQALHILAGTTYNDKLFAKGGRIDGWLTRGASGSEVVDELYLAAFSRTPTQQESAALVKLLDQNPDRKNALRDLMWAVISSREFAENH